MYGGGKQLYEYLKALMGLCGAVEELVCGRPGGEVFPLLMSVV